MGTEALQAANQLPAVSDLSRNLLNDLRPITTPFILVLDDYHRIHSEDIHYLIKEFLAHPPQAMHLVLVTRRDPPLSFSRLRGSDQMTEIRASDLRFTPDETRALLNKMIRVPIDDETGALLEKKTEGWVAGLRLAGLYLRDQEDPKQKVQELSGSTRHITEYLIEEVMSRQDPEMVPCS
jgi:LuxR family maltose regulon positive regulatory protein